MPQVASALRATGSVKSSATGPAPRAFGKADVFGWGGLALVVLLGALSGGFGGAAIWLGLYALVVALIALARGQVRWARLGSRTAGGVALGAALVAITIGGVAAPAPLKANDAVSAVPQTSTSAIAESPSATTPSQTAVSSLKTSAPQKPPVKASPVPIQKTSGVTVNTAGAVLPNSARTPGAINPSVTQANIGQTICVSGWTATVRPDSFVTTDLKVAQLASGYSYRGDTATGDYEEDHLISLEIGGAPSAEANLWPEPYNAPEGARVKDVVENKLHALVCGGTISLATAQRAIASNWWTAYQTYVGAAPAASTSIPPPVAQPAPAPAPAPVVPGGGATALCIDGTYSYAAHHQGACSHHGGVKVFYK